MAFFKYVPLALISKTFGFPIFRLIESYATIDSIFIDHIYMATHLTEHDSGWCTIKNIYTK